MIVLADAGIPTLFFYARAWRQLTLETADVRTTVFYANVASYAFLFVLACGWLLFAATTQRLGFVGM